MSTVWDKYSQVKKDEIQMEGAKAVVAIGSKGGCKISNKPPDPSGASLDTGSSRDMMRNRKVELYRSLLFAEYRSVGLSWSFQLSIDPAILVILQARHHCK